MATDPTNTNAASSSSSFLYDHHHPNRCDGGTAPIVSSSPKHSPPPLPSPHRSNGIVVSGGGRPYHPNYHNGGHQPSSNAAAAMTTTTTTNSHHHPNNNALLLSSTASAIQHFYARNNQSNSGSATGRRRKRRRAASLSSSEQTMTMMATTTTTTEPPSGHSQQLYPSSHDPHQQYQHDPLPSHRQQQQQQQEQQHPQQQQEQREPLQHAALMTPPPPHQSKPLTPPFAHAQPYRTESIIPHEETSGIIVHTPVLLPVVQHSTSLIDHRPTKSISTTTSDNITDAGVVSVPRIIVDASIITNNNIMRNESEKVEATATVLVPTTTESVAPAPLPKKDPSTTVSSEATSSSSPRYHPPPPRFGNHPPSSNQGSCPPSMTVTTAGTTSAVGTKSTASAINYFFSNTDKHRSSYHHRSHRHPLSPSSWKQIEPIPTARLRRSRSCGPSTTTSSATTTIPTTIPGSSHRDGGGDRHGEIGASSTSDRNHHANMAASHESSSASPSSPDAIPVGRDDVKNEHPHEGQITTTTIPTTTTTNGSVVPSLQHHQEQQQHHDAAHHDDDTNHPASNRGHDVMTTFPLYPVIEDHSNEYQKVPPPSTTKMMMITATEVPSWSSHCRDHGDDEPSFHLDDDDNKNTDDVRTRQSSDSQQQPWLLPTIPLPLQQPELPQQQPRELVQQQPQLWHQPQGQETMTPRSMDHITMPLPVSSKPPPSPPVVAPVHVFPYPHMLPNERPSSSCSLARKSSSSMSISTASSASSTSPEISSLSAVVPETSNTIIDAIIPTMSLSNERQEQQQQPPNAVRFDVDQQDRYEEQPEDMSETEQEWWLVSSPQPILKDLDQQDQYQQEYEQLGLEHRTEQETQEDTQKIVEEWWVIPLPQQIPTGLDQQQQPPESYRQQDQDQQEHEQLGLEHRTDQEPQDDTQKISQPLPLFASMSSSHSSSPELYSGSVMTSSSPQLVVPPPLLLPSPEEENEPEDVGADATATKAAATKVKKRPILVRKTSSRLKEKMEKYEANRTKYGKTTNVTASSSSSLIDSTIVTASSSSGSDVDITKKQDVEDVNHDSDNHNNNNHASDRNDSDDLVVPTSWMLSPTTILKVIVNHKEYTWSFPDANKERTEKGEKNMMESVDDDVDDKDQDYEMVIHVKNGVIRDNSIRNSTRLTNGIRRDTVPSVEPHHPPTDSRSNKRETKYPSKRKDPPCHDTNPMDTTMMDDHSSVFDTTVKWDVTDPSDPLCFDTIENDINLWHNPSSHVTLSSDEVMAVDPVASIHHDLNDEKKAGVKRKKSIDVLAEGHGNDDDAVREESAIQPTKAISTSGDHNKEHSDNSEDTDRSSAHEDRSSSYAKRKYKKRRKVYTKGKTKSSSSVPAATHPPTPWEQPAVGEKDNDDDRGKDQKVDGPTVLINVEDANIPTDNHQENQELLMQGNGVMHAMPDVPEETLPSREQDQMMSKRKDQEPICESINAKIEPSLSVSSDDTKAEPEPTMMKTKSRSESLEGVADVRVEERKDPPRPSEPDEISTEMDSSQQYLSLQRGQQQRPQLRYVSHQIAQDYIDFASHMMLHPLTSQQQVTTASITSQLATRMSSLSSSSAGGQHQTPTKSNVAAAAIASVPIHSKFMYGFQTNGMTYPLETISILGYLKSPFRRPSVLELWSPYEIALFEACLIEYGKQFHIISKEMNRTKSTKQVIEFYYIWKQTSHYKNWKKSYIPRHLRDDDDDDNDDDNNENSNHHDSSSNLEKGSSSNTNGNGGDDRTK